MSQKYKFQFIFDINSSFFPLIILDLQTIDYFDLVLFITIIQLFNFITQFFCNLLILKILYLVAMIQISQSYNSQPQKVIVFFVKLLGHLINQTSSRTGIIKPSIIDFYFPPFFFINFLLQLFILFFLIDSIDPSFSPDINNFIFIFLTLILLFIIIIMIIILFTISLGLFEIFRCWDHFEIDATIIDNDYLFLAMNIIMMDRSMTVEYVDLDFLVGFNPFLFEVYLTPTVDHHY